MVIDRNNKEKACRDIWQRRFVEDAAKLICAEDRLVRRRVVKQQRGVRGVARNKLLLKNVHATRYATAVEHSDTFGASNLERMEHIPERSRAALRGNEDL